MKKRTILSLAIGAIVFAAIAFQLHEEAIAETEDNLPRVLIYSVDSVSHGIYTVELVNLTTHQIIHLEHNRKGGVYPSIYGGNGGGDFSFNENHDYIIHACAQDFRWGVNSPIFHMPANVDFVLTAGPDCPPYGF